VPGTLGHAVTIVFSCFIAKEIFEIMGKSVAGILLYFTGDDVEQLHLLSAGFAHFPNRSS